MKLKTWLKISAAWLFVYTSASAWACSELLVKTDSELVAMLVNNPAPAAFDNGLIVLCLRFDSELVGRVKKLATSNKSLKNLLKQGHNFRENFYRVHQEAMPNENLDFVFNPIEGVAAWLNVKAASTVATNPVLMTEAAAARQAWQMTERQFSLPMGWTANLLLQQSAARPQLRAAGEFYKRTKTRLEQNEIPQRAVNENTPETFKKEIRRRLESIKKQNFILALSHLKSMSLRPAQIELVPVGVDNSSLKAIPFDIEDQHLLSTLRIEFIKTRNVRPDHKPKIEFSTYKQLVLRLLNKFSSTQRERENLMPPQPAVSTEALSQSVRLTFEGVDQKPHQVVLSQAEFDGFLFAALQSGTQSVGNEDRFYRRVAIEAAYRNYFYNHLLHFLEAEVDPTFEHLARRLHGYKEQIVHNPARQNHRYNFNSWTEAYLRDSERYKPSTLATDLEWYGVSLHPNYWEMRARSAREVSFNKSLPRKRNAKKAVMAYKENQRSDESRVRGGHSTVLSTVLGSAIIYLTGSNMDWQMPNFSSALPGSADASYNSWDGSFDMQNRDTEEARRNKRDLFEFTKIPANGVLPEYLNLMTNANVPSISQQASLKEGLDVESDMSLKSVGRVYPTRSLLALPSFTGWKMTSVQFIGAYSDEIIASENYVVNRSPQNGMYFAIFDYEHQNRALKYTITYRPDFLYTRLNSDDLQVPARSVLPVMRQLHSIDAVELATELKTFVKDKDTVSLADLSSVYANTGYYTDSPAKKKQYDNAWRTLGQFVQDGVFVYQCSGAAGLFDASVTMILKDQKESSLAVEKVVGYRVSSPTVTSFEAHAHILISKTDQPYHFVEFDTTPVRHESGAQSYHPPGPPRPLVPQWKLVESHSRLRLQVGDDVTRASDREDSETDSPSEKNNRPASAPQTFNIDFAKQVETLSRLQETAVQAFEKYAARSTSPGKSFSNAVGSESIATAQVFIEGFMQRKAPADLLEQMAAFDLGYGASGPWSKSQQAQIQKTVTQWRADEPEVRDNERLLNFLDEKHKRLIEELELARKLKAENSAAGQPLLDEEIATSLLSLSLYQTRLNIPDSFSSDDCNEILSKDLKSRSSEL